MKKNILSTVLLFLVLAWPAFAQTSSLPEDLREGLLFFEDSEYQAALLQFRDIIINSALEEYHGDAYYWTGRSHLALGNIEKAAQNIDFFLVQYPDHTLTAEAMYQKGRILYLQQEYQRAVRQLNTFIEKYPNNSYQSNAYFWIAESFYELGHLDKAEQLYSYIVETFPRSFKYEAANYRKSLIHLKKREQELLKLLKISHEEYLKTLEDFEQREKTYEQAISSYQRKLSAATSGREDEMLAEFDSKLSTKDQQIAGLRRELQEERSRVAELQNRISSMQSSPQAQPQQQVSIKGDADDVTRLLELKNQALSLKLYYIQWLQENQE